MAIQSDPVIETYKRDIDRTLIRENLKRTFEERLLMLQNFIEFMEELQTAGKQTTHTNARSPER